MSNRPKLIQMEVMAIMKSNLGASRTTEGVITLLNGKASEQEVMSALNSLVDDEYLVDVGGYIYRMGARIYSMEGYSPFALDTNPKEPVTAPAPVPVPTIKPRKSIQKRKRPMAKDRPQPGQNEYDVEFIKLEAKLAVRPVDDADIKIKVLKRLAVLMDESIAHVLKEVATDLESIKL